MDYVGLLTLVVGGVERDRARETSEEPIVGVLYRFQGCERHGGAGGGVVEGEKRYLGFAVREYYEFILLTDH